MSDANGNLHYFSCQHLLMLKLSAKSITKHIMRFFLFTLSLSLSLSLHNLECILFIYLLFINLSTLHLILVLFDAALKKD